MTRQEAFDKMATGLAGQNFRRSMNPDGKCAYRNPAGLKCAIGHLIPDEKYSPKMDSSSMRFQEVLSVIGVTDIADRIFYEECQGAHDYADSPELMKERLRRVAITYGLTTTSLGEP